MMLANISFGLWKLKNGVITTEVIEPLDVDKTTATRGTFPAVYALVLLLLRGFAEGCAAMTGTEAISKRRASIQGANAEERRGHALLDGRDPRDVLSRRQLHGEQIRYVMPTTAEDQLSQLGHHVFGGGIAYYALQYSTFAILVLAANTAFVTISRASPGYSRTTNPCRASSRRAATGSHSPTASSVSRLSRCCSSGCSRATRERAGFRSTRSACSVKLYAASQAGMVMHWLRTKEQGWRWRAALNGIGAFATGVVSVIQIVTKFAAGAWIVALIIPLFILLLQSIHTHYRRFAIDIAFRGRSPILPHQHTVVVPIGAVNKATAAALVYATTLSRNVRAIHIEIDEKATPRLEREWDRWDIGYELEIVSSPYRNIVRPLVEYVLQLQAETPGALVTVVTPELVPRHWWEYLLHNKTALYIRTAFLFKPSVVVVARAVSRRPATTSTRSAGLRWTAEGVRVITGEIAAIRREMRGSGGEIELNAHHCAPTSYTTVSTTVSLPIREAPHAVERSTSAVTGNPAFLLSKLGDRCRSEERSVQCNPSLTPRLATANSTAA